MKKSLLAIGVLAGLVSVKAQILTHVDDQAVLTVTDGALMYNGGGVETKGAGLIDIYGNVMVVGSSTDAFRTLDNTGANLTVPGNNIVLNLNNPGSYQSSTYGQLYINGITQANLTGFVRKQYRALNHGAYQQMGLPFYKKTLASLAANIGIAGFSNQRNNPSVMYWDNYGFPVFHDLKGTQSNNDRNALDTDPVFLEGAARYFIVGNAGWDPSSAVRNIDGVPYSDATPIQFTLKNAGFDAAGNPVNYQGGGAYSPYGERIRTYLQDAFDITGAGFFVGSYGRNLYQFANPFLTNIDLSTIGYNERTVGGDDGNNLTNIQGVRFSVENTVITGNVNGSTKVGMVTYAANGVPVGDNGLLIKPMEEFVIKMRNNDGGTLNFNTIRRFAYTPKSSGNTQTSAASVTNRNNAGTLKQVRVLGYDASNNEVARTYFVVSPTAHTGIGGVNTVQASAFSADLNTREELPTGGEDTSVQNFYWLYINEANQNDFVGKKIALYANTSKIKNYRFELAENGVALTNGQSSFVDGNNSFYIEQTPGNMVKISHNMVIPATAAQGGLYYGTADRAQLATGEVQGNSVADLYVAQNKETKLYEVIFPQGWKTATVNVFDMAGRKVRSYKDVSAAKNHVIDITTEGAYVVEITSNSGIKAIRKIVK